MKAALLLTVSIFGCRPPPTAPPEVADATDRAAESTPLEPETPTNRAAGEQLELVVPLYTGGALDLGTLRGRVVLLEISTTDDEAWAPAHLHHARLTDAHGDGLAVVVIANDADPSALEDSAMGPFVLGWDPQGALAARLQLAGFPTYLVLDREGRITLIRRGFDAEIASELRAEVERLLAG